MFFGTGMVKVNSIRSVAAEVLSQETITGLILVLQSHVTKQALKAIELFSFKVEIFQVYIYRYLFLPDLISVATTFISVTPSFFLAGFFKITDLLVNVTKHVLKPHHQVLSDEEKTALLHKFNIEEKQVMYPFLGA